MAYDPETDTRDDHSVFISRLSLSVVMRRITILLAVLAVVLSPLVFLLWGWLELHSLASRLWTTFQEAFFVRTAAYAAVIGLLSVATGTLAAWLTTVYDFAGRRQIETAYLLVTAMPLFVSARLLGGDEVDTLLLAGHPFRTDTTSLTGWPVGLASAHFSSVAYIIMRGMLTKYHTFLIETPRIAGIAPHSAGVFGRVVLPFMRPYLLTSFSITAAAVLAEFGLFAVLDIETASVVIVGSVMSSHTLLAAHIGGALLLLLVPLKVLDGFDWSGKHLQVRAKGRKPLMRYELPRFQGGLMLAVLSLPIVLGFVWPAVNLAEGLLNTELKVVEYYSISAASGFSVALPVAALTILMSFAPIYARDYSVSRVGKVLDKLSVIGYIMPGAVIATAMIVFFDSSWRHTGLLMIGSFTIHYLAVSYHAVDASFNKAALKRRETARTLGLSWLGTMFRLSIPSFYVSFLTAFMLLTVTVMQELPISLLFNITEEPLLSEAAFGATTEQLPVAALFLTLLGLVRTVILNRFLLLN